MNPVPVWLLAWKRLEISRPTLFPFPVLMPCASFQEASPERVDQNETAPGSVAPEAPVPAEAKEEGLEGGEM